MKIRWPPRPLGLGAPLNLAWFSAEARQRLVRSWWLVPTFGFAVPIGMLLIDHFFFSGASLPRVRELGSESLAFRLLVAVYSGVTEELIYRAFASVLIAWLVYWPTSRYEWGSAGLAQWVGILASTVLFGLAHVGNLPDVEYPVLRAVAVNAPAGLALGWLYWWRGLESAILTHMLAIVVLYIVVPPFL